MLIINDYLEYLNDNFNEGYFKAKMKKKQDEYN